LKFNINSHKYIDAVTNTLDGIRFTDLWGSGYSVEKANFQSKKDYSLSLKQLKSKLLILHGENDMVFPVEMAEQLHQLVPGSHLHILQNVGTLRILKPMKYGLQRLIYS
jgi:pimeloyl-ACP methyl ester carboxylesterase